MNEVKRPKKPLIYYYSIVVLILLLFNFLAMPWIAQRQVREIDYGTFMDMAENHELGQVEVDQQENQIIFTNKEGTAIYKTGMIPDPDLKQMLRDSGAQFEGEIIQQTDPLLSFLLTWVLPIVIFGGHWTVHVQPDDEKCRRTQRHDVRQVQCQSLCEVVCRDPL